MKRRWRNRKMTRPESPFQLDLSVEEILADLDSGVSEWGSLVPYEKSPT